MEISAATSAVQTMSQVQNQASVAILRKSLDITSQQGAALVAMIDQTTVPPAPGLGQNLNTQA
jgi:hypothetical protein